ncbi:fungal-specific transcription factor domain-containing protein [Talaromyces proteolyticus]|uniref:Fungal-specific transcription factor domain-containing protein n=1 Tax=Talaromyces proteolyticus TaxID=1131652 RepID=A0AAD4KQH6_9EURO|nr:fungal-specific transcription factor domain-containing protein [Talaromyces proteolyticus]KAH8693869.1 fungal-specific transcription factor domain-containing protein [Talaromyces proteolyticus]
MTRSLSPQTDSRSVERLPPNKRRHKVPASNRRRVVCACNSCNVRRIKCSGGRPCEACARNSRECMYPATGERIYVSKDEYEALKTDCAVLNRCLEESVPSSVKRESLVQKWRDAMSHPSSDKSEDDHEPSDHHDLPQGRVLRYSDNYARFHGACAGGVWIDQLRSLVRLLDSRLDMSTSSFGSHYGRIHTYDSRPIATHQVNALDLPQIDEITGLLSAFWGYTEDRNDPYGCGGIYFWGSLNDILRYAGDAAEGVATTGLCLLNATLALACQFDCFPAQQGEHSPGETFFARAKMLLGNVLCNSTTTTMQALTFMSYYLLGTGRRDTAYTYICAAMRIAILHGFHEGWVANERQRREFWNMFILDRWVSCLTGRPSSIKNESLSIGLPERVTGRDEDLPPPDGLRAHVKLALIMGDVTSKIYGSNSRKAGLPTIVAHINECLARLTDWADSLPTSLRITMSPSTENPNKIILHLIYNQLVLLCTRPLLFLAVKTRLSFYLVDSTINRRLQFPDNLVRRCVDAARQNASLICGLVESRPAVMMLTLRYHYSFNAATVLELTLLLPQHMQPEDIQLIENVLEDLKNPGQSENECSLDCAKMVAEFYAVVERFRNLTLMSSDSPDSHASSDSQTTSITSSRVLSAVELSTTYLPEITLRPDDPHRGSLWQSHDKRGLSY